jgi:hypothetical protein
VDLLARRGQERAPLERLVALAGARDGVEVGRSLRAPGEVVEEDVALAELVAAQERPEPDDQEQREQRRREEVLPALAQRPGAATGRRGLV